MNIESTFEPTDGARCHRKYMFRPNSDRSRSRNYMYGSRYFFSVRRLDPIDNLASDHKKKLMDLKPEASVHPMTLQPPQIHRLSPSLQPYILIAQLSVSLYFLLAASLNLLI